MPVRRENPVRKAVRDEFHGARPVGERQHLGDDLALVMVETRRLTHATAVARLETADSP